MGQTKPVLIIPDTKLESLGTYVLMIDMNYTGTADKLALRCYLYTVESSCLFWNNDLSEWQGEGCQVHNSHI